MQLITNPSDLTNHFARLLEEYPQYYFASAWAGIPSPVFEILLANKYRIAQFAVGIHFFQTDPRFFQAFIGSQTVRAILQPSGTFHPKLFLFYESDQDWTILIGSANFTTSAFKENTEAVVMIESREADNEFLRRAKMMVAANWKSGKRIDDAFYQAYALECNSLRAQRNKLTRQITAKDVLVAGATEIMKLDWRRYVRMFNGRRQSVNRRFEMLESIRRIFSEKRSLIKMTEDERRLICGNKNALDLPGADRHADFGTSGNGEFMHEMIVGNQIFSDALDRIPLTGGITKEDFDEFLSKFFEDSHTTDGWVSSAARILAMKRPDVFYNITKNNRTGFCNAFNNVAADTKSLANYWNLVVQKIQMSAWYNIASPANDFEKKLWDCRAAMLDVLYYEE